MKKIALALLFSATLFPMIFAQIIPTNRLVDWSKAGATTHQFSQEINVLEHGLSGDGITDNSAIFADLMNQFSNESTTFHFPEGTYVFSETLHLSSNVLLKGASSEETTFQFNGVGAAHLIKVKGQSTAEKISATQTVYKNTNYLFIDNPDYFKVGDLVRISANDSNLVTSSWALNTVGQILDIQNINNNIVVFNQIFRKNYPLIENPVLSVIQPAKNVGIECLRIIRNDAGANQTSNIYFEYATNCWVKGIESDHCNFAHIDIRSSNKITVEGSYFHHAFDYGGGGKGYGVVLQSTASDCLIQNNVFEYLRHSMLLQSGANGNVLAYNFSSLPFWTGTIFPNNAAGDLVLHGNYPYANLFEGNVVQNIIVDASHGKNGPFNTFFRNRTELYGLFTDFNTPTDSLTIVGNTVLTGDVPPIYSINGEGHFTYGNYFQSNIIPENTNDLSETSLFLMQNPSFFPENFPSTLTNNLPENTNFSIPAKDRYFDESKTLCDEPMPYVVSNGEVEQVSDFAVKCYPNPLGRSELTVELANHLLSKPMVITIFNNLGQEVLTSTMNASKKVVDLSILAEGVYFLQGHSEREVYFTERVMKVE